MKPSLTENNLDGKVIIITGSTSGTGKAIALRCAWLGAAGVVVTGRNQERGEAVVAEVEKIGRETGTSAIFVQAELTDEAQCRQIVTRCDEHFGRVDGLVNVAGRGNRGRLEDTTLDLWDQMMNLHVRAPFLLIQEASKIMKRLGIRGSIVNIGSTASNGGSPSLLPYSVSKGALATLTKSVAQSLMPDRIRAYCLNIGWTLTEQEHIVQMETGQPENWLEIADQSQAFGRILRPEIDIAPFVTFLLSDQALMITGSIIEWDQKMLLGPYAD